ncbi:MAG: LPS assembly lipoprotein LptE [Janthinobacterium lividum]
MVKNRRLILMCAAAATLAVSACGFHVRGANGSAMLPFKTMFINVAGSASLGIELRRNIEGAGGTDVIDDEKAAEVKLDILSNSRDKQVLTLNSQGRVREYTLFSRLTFQVRDNAGNILLAPTPITLRRTMSYDESLVLAKESEEATLYREMQSDMVQQILRRLAVIKSAPAR